MLINLIITGFAVSIAIIVIISSYLFPLVLRLNGIKKGVIVHLGGKFVLFLVYHHDNLADFSSFGIVTGQKKYDSFSLAFIPGLIAITVAVVDEKPDFVEINGLTRITDPSSPFKPIQFDPTDFQKIGERI